MKSNPYRPGAASAPVVLVGRDEHLRAFAGRMQESVGGYNGRSPLLHGLRGIGKTVLLNTMVDQARSSGWAATRVEASSHTSLVVDLVARSEDLLEPFAKAGRRAWERIRDTVTEVTAGAGPAKVTVKLERPANRSPDPAGDVLSVVFGPVAAAARAAGRGVALMVDELQAASEPDVAAVARLIQHVQSERLPLLVTSGGLPSARSAIARASYAERFEFFPLDYLSIDETVLAFTAPAAQQDTTFTPDALDRLLEVSRATRTSSSSMGATPGPLPAAAAQSPSTTSTWVNAPPGATSTRACLGCPGTGCPTANGASSSRWPPPAQRQQTTRSQRPKSTGGSRAPVPPSPRYAPGSSSEASSAATKAAWASPFPASPPMSAHAPGNRVEPSRHPKHLAAGAQHPDSTCERGIPSAVSA